MIHTCKAKPGDWVDFAKGIQDIVPDFGTRHTLAVMAANGGDYLARGHSELIIRQPQFGAGLGHTRPKALGVKGLCRPIAFDDHQIRMFHTFTGCKALATVIAGPSASNGCTIVLGSRINDPIRQSIAIRTTQRRPLSTQNPELIPSFRVLMHKLSTGFWWKPATYPQLLDIRDKKSTAKFFIVQTVQRVTRS